MHPSVYVYLKRHVPLSKGRLSPGFPGVICVFSQDLGAVNGRLVEITTIEESNSLEERMDGLLLQEVLRK